MKHLLLYILTLIAALYLGDAIKGTTRYHQDIGQSKSIKLSKVRYFFVGYSIGGKADGNIEWQTSDGGEPKKKEIVEFIKKTYPELSFQFNEFIIVGLYEFKTKSDCAQFFQQQKEQQ